MKWSTAAVIIVILYAIAGFLAILLAPLYIINELILFESPENPFNILLTMFSVIVVFIIIMVIVKLRLELLLKGLFYFSAFIVLFITISVLIASRSIPAAESGTGTWTETGTGQEGGYLPLEPFIWLILPISVAAIMLIVLHKFYRWYIVDAIGIFLSSSIAAWFGASLSPILIVVLLLLMALYDYLAVRSGKMVSIAENTLKMNLPTMVMSPMKKIPEKLDGEGERKGALLGLGDIAFPNMLT
ncbi:MAG: presenilin family intramembrane aspartyl protease, partial [Thermoproteota archaeon]